MNQTTTTLLMACMVIISCNGPATQSSSSFITTLGEDTLVIEQFTMHPEKVEAEVLIRSPKTAYWKQTLLSADEGSFQSFRATMHDPNNISGEPLESQTIEIDGDSLVITQIRDTVTRNNRVAYDPAVIPWFDMVHWPYEVATRWMVYNGLKEVDQPMLTGNRARVFEIRTLAEDSVSIKHPFRGTMFARINESGALEYYDATATTRKLIVRRGGPVDMAAYASMYADKSITSLSGAATTENQVHGANIEISFGQPARRGRELFGGIVPWNERWRTGANRATHLKTDRTLVFGDVTVPPGEYTLFTIPAPDGGTLIINRQTGQNGRSYDEEQDLGRVPMTITTGDGSIELFTIDAIERGDEGVLRLMWGETIFEVGFRVGK